MISENEKNSIDVVAYCRYSSDNQREESIDAQKRAIEKYALENNYNIVHYYIDQAQSATTDQRDNFQLMMNDLMNKKSIKNLKDVSCVIVHKFDRFSRDRLDFLFYKKELLKREITLLSVSEFMPSGPEAIMIESLYTGMNEFYSANLSREVKKGMLENVYNGKSTGSVPLGFKVNKDTKQIEVDEKTAPTIRLIFEEFVYKKSTYNEIIDKLKWMNCKTAFGNDFTKSSILDILKNVRYIGCTYYYKSKKDPVTKKRVRRTKEEQDKVLYVENVNPPIIDRKTFERAQEILNFRHKHAGTYCSKQSNNLLVGLVFCGECGAPMATNNRKNGYGHTYITLRCNNKKKNSRNCNNSEISLEHLQRYVILNLMDFIKKPDSVSKIILGIKERYRIDMCNLRDDKSKLEKEIKKLDVKKSKLIDRLVDAPTTGVQLIYDEFENINKQKDELLSKLESINDEDIEEFHITNEEVIEMLETMEQYMLSEKNELIQEVLHSFIERINVSKEGVEIIYSLNLFYCSHKKVFDTRIDRKELKRQKGINPNILGNYNLTKSLFDFNNPTFTIHKALSLISARNTYV